VWPAVTLNGGSTGHPGEADYAAGADLLAATREVALMAAPDLETMPGGDDARNRILGQLTGLAEQCHDRQVIAALPRAAADMAQIAAWLDDFRAARDGEYARSLALYHPMLTVQDPLGGIRAPVRRMSPVGHVAGVISRLDRERGAHHTPANAELYQAVDIEPRLGTAELGALAMAGVNPLLCATGNGIMVWGGRTAYPPALGTGGLFLAHRRLIHRLIRAIRRVAEPIIFDTNGPDLRLTLARAITSLLLDAWNAGALKGDVPEEAFQVRCDAGNNPPEVEEAGQVFCEIRLAPAAPMEFITLRIAMTREGRLEAIES
jgi:phage tail sheath protein FI